MPLQNAGRRKRRNSADAMATIEARGLRKVFGTTVALDGIDLRVEEGRILGIIGPNGAGKTTTLTALLDLMPHDTRRVYLRGHYENFDFVNEPGIEPTARPIAGTS